MKTVILNATGLVVAEAVTPNGWASVTHPDGVRALHLPDASPVTVGWQHTEPPVPAEGEAPTVPDAQPVAVVAPPDGLVDLTSQFTAPAFQYAPIDTARFYLCFTGAERIKIKGSADPFVREFWETYQIYHASKTPIDPNTGEVHAALAYFARPVDADPPGPGILANLDRVSQILAGQTPL